MNLPVNQILQGDCIEVMNGLPEESIQCVVTSPPYWKLRDYGIEGQFGLEKTLEEYITKMVEIFRSVWRVLRKDGTVWLNLGDSYVNHSTPGGGDPTIGRRNIGDSKYTPTIVSGLKPKDLCMIPDAVARALRTDGWWVRSAIIWFKKNPMPEPVNGWRWEQHRVKIGNEPERTESGKLEGMRKHSGNTIEGVKWQDCPGCPKCEANDGLILRKGSWRPTSAYETVYMLTKSGCYFGDAEAVREPSNTDRKSKASHQFGAKDGKMNTVEKAHAVDVGHKWEYKPTRNPRNVWTIATQPLRSIKIMKDGKLEKFDHFASFPEKLVEPCIKVGTSERGHCPECGAGWVRVVEKNFEIQADVSPENAIRSRDSLDASNNWRRFPRGSNHPETIKWLPSCKCDAGDLVPAVVLDPFGGSGTVGKVCQRLGRHYIMVELNPKYCELAEERLRKVRLL